MTKLKMWDPNKWNESELEWEKSAREAKKNNPIKMLSVLPKMVGITPDTAKFLKWKSLWWMITKDKDWKVFKGFFKRPFKHMYRLLTSALKTRPYVRKDDFFFYGIKNTKEFENLLVKDNTILILGFSYCHKPFECPSGRFTPNCISDLENLVCRQCFIGKAVHAGKEKQTIPLFIPTIHYIGEKVFEIVEQHPKHEIIFIITACEMTLEMFGDWGNMAGIKGIGVRLDGRICNTMKAFALSENGIKPGLTVVTDETQGLIMSLLKCRKQRHLTFFEGK